MNTASRPGHGQQACVSRVYGQQAGMLGGQKAAVELRVVLGMNDAPPGGFRDSAYSVRPSSDGNGQTACFVTDHQITFSISRSPDRRDLPVITIPKPSHQGIGAGPRPVSCFRHGRMQRSSTLRWATYPAWKVTTHIERARGADTSCKRYTCSHARPGKPSSTH